MHRHAIGTLVELAGLSIATSALAARDHCPLLAANGNYCGNFVYSTGSSNSFPMTFSSGGGFNLNGNSPGTYTCAGESLFEVDYAFGGSENQVWYGKVAGTGRASGYGKSTTGGYLYSFKLAPGTCAVHYTAPGQPQNK